MKASLLFYIILVAKMAWSLDGTVSFTRKAVKTHEILHLNTTKGKNSLATFNEKRRAPAHKYFLSDEHLVSFMSKLYAGVSAKREPDDATFFVDFDAVLGRQVLEHNGKRYVHILNIINTVLRPQIQMAKTRLEKDERFDKIMAKIDPKKKAQTNKQKIELIFNAIHAFKNNFILGSAYSVSYEVVSPHLREFLLEQKKNKAKLYVLSGMPFSAAKGDFLRKNYGDLFALQDAIPFHSTLSSLEAKFEPSNSYIYSEKKNLILESFIVNSPRSSRIIFIDDHVTKVGQVRREIDKMLENSFLPLNHLCILIPFPSLSAFFKSSELVNEIYEVVMSWDEELTERIRNVIFSK